MVDVLHANDVAAVVYVNVTEDGEALGAALDAFVSRTVRLRRARTDDVVVITGVTTEVDPDDSVRKLKLLTGTSELLALTGTGGFKLLAANSGMWIAEVALSDGTWTGITEPFELFDLHPNLS